MSKDNLLCGHTATHEDLPPNSSRKSQQVLEWAEKLGVTRQTLSFLCRSFQIRVDRMGNIVLPRKKGGFFLHGTGEPELMLTKGKKSCGAAYLKGPNAHENSPMIICAGVRDSLILCQMCPDAEIAIVGGNLRADVEIRHGQQVKLAFGNSKVGCQHELFFKNLFPDAEPLVFERNH